MCLSGLEDGPWFLSSGQGTSVRLCRDRCLGKLGRVKCCLYFSALFPYHAMQVPKGLWSPFICPWAFHGPSSQMPLYIKSCAQYFYLLSTNSSNPIYPKVRTLIQRYLGMQSVWCSFTCVMCTSLYAMHFEDQLCSVKSMGLQYDSFPDLALLTGSG